MQVTVPVRAVPAPLALLRGRDLDDLSLRLARRRGGAACELRRAGVRELLAVRLRQQQEFTSFRAARQGVRAPPRFVILLLGVVQLEVGQAEVALALVRIM